MSDKEQHPTKWSVVETTKDRAVLLLDCSGNCSIPLSKAGPSQVNGCKRWGWDGNIASPTITPSIDCQRCGWHRTIVGGEAK